MTPAQTRPAAIIVAKEYVRTHPLDLSTADEEMEAIRKELA